MCTQSTITLLALKIIKAGMVVISFDLILYDDTSNHKSIKLVSVQSSERSGPSIKSNNKVFIQRTTNERFFKPIFFLSSISKTRMKVQYTSSELRCLLSPD